MAGMKMEALTTATHKEPGDDADAPTVVGQDDIARQELQVKEAERIAKVMAKESDSYVGMMARYNEEEGFGFVVCPECVERWGKTDIFIGNKNFAEAKLKVGDAILFQVEKDGKDLPRVAETPKVLKELTREKRKFAKMKETAKADSMLKRSATAMTAGGGAAGLPEAKRMNVGFCFNGWPGA